MKYNSGVYRSIDNGENWTEPTLTDQTVYSLAVSGINIFAGTDNYPAGSGGVYLSIDNGSNWIQRNQGFNGIPSSNALLIANSYIFIGTEEYSVWRRVFNEALPVKLASFTSNVNGRNIILNWVTTSEQNNYGFDIERKSITGNFAKVVFVEGKGTVNTSTNYSFEDKNLNTGKYTYRLKQIDYNGNYEYFELNGEVVIGVPKKFTLSQNYPNPFNPVTKINFELPVDGKVTLVVYDVIGREVSKLFNNEFRSAGYYTTEFNASKFASGVYFYRLTTDAFSETKRMLMIK